MSQPVSKHMVRYAVAVLAVVPVFFMKLLLPGLVGEELPFLFFFLTVICSGWYGGLGPGLVTTALSALVFRYLFIDENYFRTIGITGTLRIVLFIFEGTLISGLMGLLHATTQRSEASFQARRVSDQQYRQMVETASEGILTIDHEGRLTYVNRRLADWLGYSPDEMLGHRSVEFMDDVARAKALMMFERRKQGISERFELHFLRK